MSDLDRLIDGFDAGELIRPFDGPSLIDVVRAAAHVCGVPDMPMSPASRAIAEQLDGADHLVLLLADGLGTSFVEGLSRDSWLRRHMQRSIQATFPPTTATALTTIATGAYPAQHTITGWWTHLPSLNAAVTVLHNARAADEVSLDALGVPFRELCPIDPLMPRMRRDAASVLPGNIVDSPYTRYMAGDGTCIAYGRHAEAAWTVADRITQATGPTYTYWYTPYPDSLAHEFGTQDSRVLASIEDLDGAVGKLVGVLRDRGVAARIIVTADHGHLDVGGAGHLEVTADDPLLAFLETPPSGDVRTLYWHVRPGRHEAFIAAFAARFGEQFLLLTTAEVEDTRLFGPDALSDEMRARIGDFTSIALGREVLRYTGAPGRDRYFAQRSHHSGLSPAEMMVPLIIIRTEDDT